MADKSKNILKFITPASSFTALWREGLLSGNGTVGINVLGGAGREVVMINHADLFWQGNTGVLPDVSDKVKNIKKNLDNGNYKEAESVLTNALNAKNYRPESAYPLPLCDIVLTTPIEKTVSDYYRCVNLETGEIEVSYKDRNAKFIRDIFVSRANDLICYEIFSSNSKKVCCEISLSVHDKSNNRTRNFESFDIFINSETKTDKDFIVFSARNDDGTDFGCVSRVLCFGGTLNKNPESFSVKNADKVLILSKVFVGAQKEEAIEKLKKEILNVKSSYNKLLKEHFLLHAKFMNTTEINLSSQKFDNIEEALLFTRSKGLSLSILEKLYAYGKYLLICSGGKNPYGLFNGDYKAYQSTTENYLQIQRLFNFMFKANLTNMLRPLFDRFFENLDDYKKNAARIYGCKGIFVPSLEAPESGLPGSTLPGVVLNFNVAAYICAMIFQYYLQTDDLDFIKEKGYEILEETGFFYEDILKTNKVTKVFESPFGYSPFNSALNVLNKNKENLCIASNCVCDFVCAKYVFSSLVRLANVLGKEEKEIERWQKLLNKIPDIEIDKNGIIKEYNSNAFETNNTSPYIPHMFPYNVALKPFVSKRDFEDLIANSVVFRYSNSGNFNAENLVDMAVALATCGSGNAAFEVLSSLIRNFVSNNLIFSNGDFKGMGVGVYDPWATFSIDKNTALCACLQNMFVNSSKNTISLFRNLPGVFTKGSVYNLTLDNQIRADLDFNVRRGIVKLKLRSPKSTTINLSLPNGFRKIKGIEQTKIDNEQLILNGVNLQANKTIILKIYFNNKI